MVVFPRRNWRETPRFLQAISLNNGTRQNYTAVVHCSTDEKLRHA